MDRPGLGESTPSPPAPLLAYNTHACHTCACKRKYMHLSSSRIGGGQTSNAVLRPQHFPSTIHQSYLQLSGIIPIPIGPMPNILGSHFHGIEVGWVCRESWEQWRLGCAFACGGSEVLGCEALIQLQPQALVSNSRSFSERFSRS